MMIFGLARTLEFFFSLSTFKRDKKNVCSVSLEVKRFMNY